MRTAHPQEHRRLYLLARVWSSATTPAPHRRGRGARAVSSPRQLQRAYEQFGESTFQRGPPGPADGGCGGAARAAGDTGGATSRGSSATAAPRTSRGRFAGATGSRRRASGNARAMRVALRCRSECRACRSTASRPVKDEGVAHPERSKSASGESARRRRGAEDDRAGAAAQSRRLRNSLISLAIFFVLVVGPAARGAGPPRSRGTDRRREAAAGCSRGSGSSCSPAPAT